MKLIMEPAGNEQRIQALFLELKAKDEQFVPQFVGLWNRAQLRGAKSRPSLRSFYAAAACLLVLVLGSLIFWSRSWQRQGQLVPKLPTVAGDFGTHPTLQAVVPRKKDLGNQTDADRRLRRLASERRAHLLKRQAVISNARAIAVWQSPTTALLQSPAEDVLSALPQLTQSALELKSFLPRPGVEENQ